MQQLVVSRVETLDETSSSACCCMPSGVFVLSIRCAAEGTSTAPTFDFGPRNTTSDFESEELRMIGNFDGSANEFWELFKNEANNHDEARINTLKEGMDSALIFDRSFYIRAHNMDLVMLMRGSIGWFIFCIRRR